MNYDNNPHQNLILYTRRGEEISGPFPAGQITRYILLGRVRLDDELSEDQISWKRVSGWDNIVPDVLNLDMSIPENREKLEAAKRWADERRVGREDGKQERRAPETEEIVHYREVREQVIEHSRRPLHGTLFLLLTLTVVATILWFAYLYTPSDDYAVADCQAPAGPGVVWNNCNMDGRSLHAADLSSAHIENASLNLAKADKANFTSSKLSYSSFNSASLQDANFSSAQMVGASLRNSDLRGANLNNANLAYADLTDALLEGTDLKGVILDHAYWIDGTKCAPGSKGECK
ncbi:MAG: pentapeptide repeat-containing protein [Gammaproteobacteria bacterium]|nr:pentapeptide repeat-containing protein [Gammaproteobacteria bacterium]